MPRGEFSAAIELALPAAQQEFIDEMGEIGGSPADKADLFFLFGSERAIEFIRQHAGQTDDRVQRVLAAARSRSSCNSAIPQAPIPRLQPS